MQHHRPYVYSFADDIRLSFKAHVSWIELGWNDMRERCRQSVIAPFADTLSIVVLVVVLGLVCSPVFGIDARSYVPYIAVSFMLWSLVATTTIECCAVFLDNEHLIKQARPPLAAFVLRVVWRNLLRFLPTFFAFAVVGMIFGISPGMSSLLAVPALLLVLFNQVWVGIVVAIASTRLSEAPRMVGAMVQVSLLATPIMWPATVLGDQTLIADVNPLHHLIDIVRAPLLGAPSAPWSWLVALGLNAIDMLIAMLLLRWLHPARSQALDDTRITDNAS